ncbi:DEAD/DEAH box helicase [Paraflavitalea pollutisoli]|uniref:DEAD/DEAH box helicase n=1 Tax=Paraflavitalea pollutisoli TaxID=3034143 RepID=UPI0023EAE7F2|nr:DEAD/DEAH box helicase [Paraflavitalea sp. H1-2-19X]
MIANEILARLLQFELKIQAIRLQFLEGDVQEKLDEDFLMEILVVINELSLKKDEPSQRLLIGIAALLWNYKDPAWDGLRDHLLLLLSRAGFGPSTIMLDREYSRQEKTYSFGTGLMNSYAVGLAQARNEIFVGGVRFMLTDFQKELWDSLRDGRLVGISAPTSAGKSFLILLKAIEQILEDYGTVVYIVPTLSLVNQVVGDFRKMLNQFGLQDYSIETSYNPAHHTLKTIYVLTQERAIAAFSLPEVPFGEVRMLVVDEIQNVERVGNPDELRAKVLYDMMVEFRNRVEVDLIIVSGPRIVKIDELSTNIFGKNAVKKETKASPVLNLTYSVHRKGEQYYFKVFCDLLKAPLEVKIAETERIKGYGQVQYRDGYLNYLKGFAENLDDECVLIFSPTPDTCITITDHLKQSAPDQDKEYLNGLAAYIADTVHPDYGLPEVIRKGITYHHARLPSHVRRVVEHAVKEGAIKVVVATTTLLQGVNLPVQNIIIRNPNLNQKKKNQQSSRLSNYELANLRGRAGRLLQDFIGRTFIMDEESFQESKAQQLDLFKDTEKELQVGYGKKYNEFKRDITSDLKAGRGLTEENAEYSYVTTYIRQTVLKHGLRAQVPLNSVGIQLTDRELNDIIAGLNSIELDRDLCARNRYWDPLDLERMRTLRLPVTLPTKPGDFDNAARLKALLQFMEQYFPAYYKRHFKVEQSGERDILISICILADKWANEKQIREILATSFYSGNTKRINAAIKHMEKNIAQGMALLFKPLYDVKAGDSMYPRFLEVGAYKPLTRRLIDLNIPRETAIYLGSLLRNINNDTSRNELIKEIRRIRKELPYWYQVQLDNI